VLRLLPLLLIALGCTADDGDVVLVGTLERTLIEIVAPTSETIVEITALRGQRVEAGAPLARLDPTLAEAEIARAQARLAGSQTGVVVANHELERVQELHVANVSSQRALERAQLERSEAYARLHEAEALLAAARKRRRDLDLVAPVASTVDQIPFDPGERVPVGGVLVVLIEAGDPWVRVWIPEDRFVRVLPGTPAEVRIDGHPGVLPARVLDVAREPAFTPHFALTERDRAHLVYEARVVIPDAPASLRPGVPADVRLLVGERVAATP